MEGRFAVVTGGTSGIGRASAEALLAAGAAGVLLNGRDAQRAERARGELASRFPGRQIAIALGDAAQPDHASAIIGEAVSRFGRIDVLVNSTGGNDLPRLLQDTDPGEIPHIVQRCMLAPLLCCRAALPHLRAAGGGAVINIASDAAKLATPGESVIGAAMAGIVMFTRTLAIEGKRDGIRANVVTPSLTRGTDHYERLMADPFCAKLFGKAARAASLGLVEKEDLAQLVAFLASPAAAKITGQAISVTGGISAI